MRSTDRTGTEAGGREPSAVLRAGVRLGLALLLLTPLGGCWDDRELSELGIASGSAYDWENNQFVGTYQIINPSSGASGTGGSGAGSSSSPPFVTFRVSGPTIMEAMEKTNLTSTRQLFLSHSRVVILSNKLAQEKGIAQLVDLFLRKPDARETVYVFITDGEAGRILDQLMQLSKNQGAGIQLMIEQESKLASYYPGIRMFELAMALFSDSNCAAVPEILLSGGKKMDKTDEVSQTDLPSRLTFGRLAILKKDRFIGWLSQPEALGLSFLRNRVQMTNISFPSLPDLPNDDSSFSIQHSTTTVHPVWDKDHYVMNVSIKAGGYLSEIGSDVNLGKERSIARMEQAIEANVLKIVQRSWRSVHRMNADVTEFATLIHREDPRRWKQIKAEGRWEDVFRDIELRLKVTMKIERIGLSNKSFKAVENQD
ncbi:Ger(x)C family spore germination protein [Paenibacillus spiritus]|uniref:Ger(X)C family spore germination protein n=1 Tax=Paenibacillus spiritus TaxID=2496557 RepID=A0A5J5G9I9_9BACL|nr:Ger(x)C family spore germination protein [Paenibacillus spiritus]KAA9004849.1 Ger(x)C family spore germination protein [Paenibacillus spiritus]